MGPDRTHEREELINRMRGYWLVTRISDQPLEATKYETLAELEEAFDDLETEYTKWLKKAKPYWTGAVLRRSR